MGRKIASLIQLAAMGFNTPEFELLFNPEDLTRCKDQMRSWERVSVRTDLPGDKIHFKLPFYPNQEWDRSLELAGMLLSDGYQVILSRAKELDPQLSLVAGKYSRQNEMQMLEFFVGPGTIRQKMEDDSSSLYRISIVYPRRNFTQDQTPLVALPFEHRLREVVNDCRQLGGAWIITEWSLYPHPVGKKGYPLIYWEFQVLHE